jgi:Ca2+-binding RTX toxin-like protein
LNLSGYDGSSNPFGSGYMRFVQEGADTLWQIDSDGAAGGENYQTAFKLIGVDASAITSANFSPYYQPDGGGVQGQQINGTESAETLEGTVGDDTIFGMDGSDTLSGSHGNDRLDGGNDSDYLSGGYGADTFVFSSNLGAGNIDSINDFVSGVDQIWLSNTSGAPFAALPDGYLYAGAFDLIGDTTPVSADTRIMYDPDTGALYYDADGDGAGSSMQFATLVGHPMITASDLMAGA